MSEESRPPVEGAEEASEEEDHYRRRLYQIMSDPTVSSETKRQRLLDLGRERLDLANGHIVEIDREMDRHEITATSGSDVVEAGDVTPLEQTFCQETIATEEVLTISDASHLEWGEDVETPAEDIGCYIGNKLLVGNSLHGTLCFVDTVTRDEAFTTPEQSFVTLLSSAIGRLLEREGRDETLRDQEGFDLFISEVEDYAIIMLDPAGHVVSWNQGAQRIKGYSEAEILDEHFSRFHPAEDIESGRPERLLERARQIGRVEDEGWRVRKDGSEFWALVTITVLYDDDGVLRGFGKVTRDQTDRRQAQQALQAEQQFINRALDSLHDLFFVLTPDGGFDRVNDRFLEVTGYTEEQILSMDPAEFFVTEDRETITEALIEAVETGEATVEATVLTRNKERRRYEFRGRRLSDDTGEVTGIVGIGRDITERELYEQRQEVSQRLLRHNLRNELNSISGWVEVLEETATEQQQEAVDRILGTIGRLTDLSEKTHQMIELESNVETSEPTIDIGSLIQTVVADFREQYPAATIEVEQSPADSLELPTGKHVEIAIRNALENAIEHNPADEPWVSLDITRREGEVQIHVEDDGPSIPDMEQSVLEKGSETTLEHGSGLGLWLIHWCVTTAGGEIDFSEREPRGNKVTLCFPVYDE